jgi:uncharacterized protein
MATELALISGASSGIGLHLARQFCAHGHPVVLVAPVEEELNQIAAELAGHGADVHVIACDLEQPDAAERVFAELESSGLTVDILANNAGHGQLGLYWEVPIARHLSIVRLNIEAHLRMTSLFLPGMLARGRGRILNTASIAGFEPGPRLSVYHASKAFILSWSEALASELADTPVSVTTLCPGPTDTDFFPKADMQDTRAFQKANLMAPQDVAKAAYKAVMAGDRLVVPGAANKAMVFSRRFMSEAMQAGFNEKLYEDVPPESRTRARGDCESGADRHH